MALKMNGTYTVIIASLGTFSIGCLITIVSYNACKKIISKIAKRTKTQLDDYIANALLEKIKPKRSVDVNNVSLKDGCDFLNLIALPLSIKCGKSISQSWGGTYGHFVIKHKSHK